MNWPSSAARTSWWLGRGGVIPPEDFQALKDAGVAAIFTPGTVIPEAAIEVMERLERTDGLRPARKGLDSARPARAACGRFRFGPPGSATGRASAAPGETTEHDERLGPSPDEAPVIRVVAMPADTNPAGDIFGGWLMSWMDLAAGTIAARRARGRASDGRRRRHDLPASRSVVGDEVSFYADLIGEGRSFDEDPWRRPGGVTESPTKP